MKLKIIDMDHLGKGIAKDNNKVIFVPKTVTGDVCDASIYKSYKKYDIAKLDNIIYKSNLRVDSICPYYNECGGCNISNLDYEHQLDFKVNKVKNVFKKYLNVDINPKSIGSICEYGYRNKVTYHNDNHFGLVSEYDGIVNIDNCIIANDDINKLFRIIKEEDLSQVKTVAIRKCDNGLTVNIIGNMNIDSIKKYCIEIIINNKCIYHKSNGFIAIKDINYKVSSDSFFQINTTNISVLYDEIINLACFKKNDKVIDLYCGVGSISLYIAKYVDSVLGIEIVENAIKDAKENAKSNNINNVNFICGDVSKLIDNNLYGDVLIVDPPRSGLDNHTIDVINDKKINKIIYVSCDVMSLVRDIKILASYELNNISVIDMFPQTHHVECVCLLLLKN